MLSILISALINFGIYSLFVLLYTVVGAYQNINIWGKSWDWKIWLNGLVKWLVLGGVVIGAAAGSFLLLDQAAKNGVELLNVQAIAPKAIIAVVIVASGLMLVKIVAKLGTALGLSKEDLERLQQAAVDIDPNEPLVFNLDKLPKPSKAYVEAKLKDEEVGGIGTHYSVPTSSYQAFKAAVNGNGYDIDNHFGWQCWDGAALLWQQFGKTLHTGNGLAIGCWDLKREANRYDLFDLVTDVNSLKPGDVVVMRPNHIAFFDGYEGNNMRILGQNQGGRANPAGGSAFNLVLVNKSTFAGAFRLKKWNVTPPTPAPTPTPTPSPAPAPAPQFNLGDTVIPTRLVDYDGTPLTQYDDTYTITEIIGDRAVLSARGAIWAAMNTGSIRKA